MSTPNPVPTLAQAQQASFMVDLCNTNINALNAQASGLAATIGRLTNYNPAGDLATAQAQLAAVQGALAIVQQNLADAVAAVNAYNTANPDAQIPVG